MSSSRGCSQLEIESKSPTLQADSLPTDSTGKPKNIGVGSLPLHQGIFLTQESNWGLLHCRWILTRWDTREALVPQYVRIKLSVKNPLLLGKVIDVLISSPSE